MTKLYDYATQQLRRLYDRYISTPSVLDDRQYFIGARSFAARWQALRQEALDVARNLQQVPRFHELMAEQAEISANDGKDWRVFLLKAYGVEIKHNMAMCPELARLLRAHPEVLSATLSFLAPQKHIPRHRGPFRGILRFYMGLDVPVDDQGQVQTVLGIEDQEHRIASGQYLLWDDTYPHEVWNRSEHMRIALLLDVRRPGLPWGLEVLTRFIVKMIGWTVIVRRIAQ
jgi:aspartate beta-hydroxylase